MHYDKTLRIARGACDDDIQEVYCKLAPKYHPDKNKDEGAGKKYNEIIEAHEVLIDERRRDIVDTNKYESPKGFTISRSRFPSRPNDAALTYHTNDGDPTAATGLIHRKRRDIVDTNEYETIQGFTISRSRFSSRPNDAALTYHTNDGDPTAATGLIHRQRRDIVDTNEYETIQGFAISRSRFPSRPNDAALTHHTDDGDPTAATVLIDRKRRNIVDENKHKGPRGYTANISYLNYSDNKIDSDDPHNLDLGVFDTNKYKSPKGFTMPHSRFSSRPNDAALTHHNNDGDPTAATVLINRKRRNIVDENKHKGPRGYTANISYLNYSDNKIDSDDPHNLDSGGPDSLIQQIKKLWSTDTYTFGWILIFLIVMIWWFFY